MAEFLGLPWEKAPFTFGVTNKTPWFLKVRQQEQQRKQQWYDGTRRD